MSKDDAYLLEMLEAARLARAFRGESSEAEFEFRIGQDGE